MRKAKTRGMINRTFMHYTGTVTGYDRTTGKTMRGMKFDFIEDKYEAKTGDLVDIVQRNAEEHLIILSITKYTIEELVYSMSKEDFLQHATIL